MAKNPDSKTEESTEYDNCLDIAVRKDREDKTVTLSDFLPEGEEMDKTDEEKWKKQWVGMPEYSHKKDAGPYKTIYVHFRNLTDYEEFMDKIEQKLTMKTKSIWHPKLDRTANSLLRWVEDEE